MSEIDTSTEAVEALKGMTKACIDFADCETRCRESHVCVARVNIIRELISTIRSAAFEEAAKVLEIDRQTIRLHAGELTASEMRAVVAILTWKASEIRSLAEKEPQK